MNNIAGSFGQSLAPEQMSWPNPVGNTGRSASQDSQTLLFMNMIRVDYGSAFNIPPEAVASMVCRSTSASSSSAQTAMSSDGKRAIVIDGYFTNIDSLRAKLTAAGCHTPLDTGAEVALQSFSHWGVGSFTRFRGSFALVIFDVFEHSLFLVRDQFGTKPLYFTASSEGTAFASTIPDLLRLMRNTPNIDPSSLYDFLLFGKSEHTGRTLLNGVGEVPPAHFLKVSLDASESPVLSQYWKVDLSYETRCSFEEAADTVRDLFHQSTYSLLQMSGSLGASLSGGTDSSSVVMVARQIDPDRDFATFSYVAAEDGIDEEEWIDLINREAGTSPHKVKMTLPDLKTSVYEVVKDHGKPLRSSNVIPQRSIFQQAASSGVELMMDGVAADGLMGGHSFYLSDRFASLIRSGNFIDAYRMALSAVKLSKSPHLINGTMLLLPKWVRSSILQRDKHPTPAWLDNDWFRQRNVHPHTSTYGSGKRLMHSHMHEGLVSTGTPRLLSNLDRSARAAGVEVGLPFLNVELVEYVYSLPDRYLMSLSGEGKAVFQRAMRGIVPDAILDRRDKVGFNTPEMRWLSSNMDWVRTALENGVERGLPIRLGNLLTGRSLDRQGANLVWRCLTVAVWAECFDISFD